MAIGIPRGMNDKLSAAFAWIITGNSIDASKLCGIPDRTIRDWTNEPWWGELLTEARKMKQEELDADLTDIIHKAVGKVKERVEQGDAVIGKHGDIQYKPVSARDLSVVAAVFMDKRALLRGDPTSRTERIDPKSRLKELQQEFKKIGETKDAEELEDVTHH